VPDRNRSRLSQRNPKARKKNSDKPTRVRHAKRLTLDLDADEVFAATLCLQVFRDIGAMNLVQGIGKPLDKLLRKLRRVLTESRRSELDPLVTSIVDAAFHDATGDHWLPWDPSEPWTGPRYDPTRARTVLRKAIAQNLDVEMEYFTHARGQFTKRRVTPLAADGAYFIGYCHGRDEERTFRIDRVATIRLVKEGAERARKGTGRVPACGTKRKR